MIKFVQQNYYKILSFNKILLLYYIYNLYIIINIIKLNRIE